VGENWKSRSLFLVLLALDEEPKHGYDIAAHLRERTSGFFDISFGALYPVLHKLEKDGLIKGTWEKVGVHRQRKVYALTAKGRRALGEERERYDALVGAFAKLLGSGGKP
jgi:DNA-binding PadR family transcriptional regulator